MLPDRWEHGSEFAWPDLPRTEAPARYPWSGSSATFYGSGRDALRGLVDHGIARRGWRRLWLPAFLCQEVVAAARSTGIELAVYPDDPRRPVELPAASLRAGDAVLVLDTFGLREPLSTAEAPAEVDLIEDHSHDLGSDWARHSHAAFALGSLRKTLPVPDGGVVWSPRGLALPDEPPLTDTRRRAWASKSAAMLLKRLYLDGLAVSKDTYRSLAADGEDHIAEGAVSAASPLTRALLPLFPLARWAQTRRANRQALSRMLAQVEWLRVLEPADPEATGFSVVLVVDTAERRERLRRGLIEHRIYPAVLWPLERTVVPVPEDAIDLSRRILSLHCDFRYGPEDMARVADAVRKLG